MKTYRATLTMVALLMVFGLFAGFVSTASAQDQVQEGQQVLTIAFPPYGGGVAGHCYGDKIWLAGPNGWSGFLVQAGDGFYQYDAQGNLVSILNRGWTKKNADGGSKTAIGGEVRTPANQPTGKQWNVVWEDASTAEHIQAKTRAGGQTGNPVPDDSDFRRPVQTSVLRIGLGGDQLFPELYREREALAQAYRANYQRMQAGQPHYDLRQIAQRYQQVDGFLKSIPVSDLVLLNGKQLSDRQVNELVHRLRTDPGMRGRTYTVR